MGLRETIETVTDFILRDSKITADGDCNREIKRRLLLGRKAMTNLDNISKSRDITLPTKVYLVKSMVFPVVMYGCDNMPANLENSAVTTDLEKVFSFQSLGLQGDPTSPF